MCNLKYNISRYRKTPRGNHGFLLSYNNNVSYFRELLDELTDSFDRDACKIINNRCIEDTQGYSFLYCYRLKTVFVSDQLIISRQC